MVCRVKKISGRKGPVAERERIDKGFRRGGGVASIPIERKHEFERINLFGGKGGTVGQKVKAGETERKKRADHAGGGALRPPCSKKE